MKKKIKLAILLMATALIGVSQDQGLLTNISRKQSCCFSGY